MTSTDLIVREHAPERVQLSTEQIQFLANTEFVDKRIRGNLPAIFATIATGREIGIGDMAALRHVFMVDGRPGYSAEIMVALVYLARLGHSITGSTSSEQATAKGRRGDTGAEIEVTWTIEDAKRAGLLNKKNWREFPQSMLWARAVSQLCRMLFPDVAVGNSFYTPEELGEEHTDEGGGLLLEEAPRDPEPADAEVVEVNPIDGEPAAVVDPVDEKDKKRLNILVAKLRAADRDPAQWLYDNYVRAAALVPVSERVVDGRLRFSPLRDRLTRSEAKSMVAALDGYVKSLPKGAA